MGLFEGVNVISPVGPLFATFLIGFTTLVLLFWRSLRKQQYWKKLGVPYTPPIPFFGSMLEGLKKSGHDIELDRYNKYGRIYGHYEGNRPILSVAEPDIIRNILVKDFFSFTGRRNFEMGDKMLNSMVFNQQGEDWKRVRSILSPTFTTGKIKMMLSIFKDCSRTLVKNFKVAADKGEPIEVKIVYGAFAMDIIASSAFSTKIDSHNDPNNAFVQTAKSVISRSFQWRFLFFCLRRAGDRPGLPSPGFQGPHDLLMADADRQVTQDPPRCPPFDPSLPVLDPQGLVLGEGGWHSEATDRWEPATMNMWRAGPSERLLPEIPQDDEPGQPPPPPAASGQPPIQRRSRLGSYYLPPLLNPSEPETDGSPPADRGAKITAKKRKK